MFSMSPRTQTLGQQGPSGEEEKQLFEQGFSEIAYNTLVNKIPAASPDVVTFKILDSDAKEGYGVGAFVLMRSGVPLYIPVVMVDSQIKPLELLYFKEQNIFLPLTKEWLDRIDQTSLDELGDSSTLPGTMATDVDLRNAVVPPVTGRYSYAASALDEAHLPFEEARRIKESKLKFLSFLEEAPNRVKEAVAVLFEGNPRILKEAVKQYGKTALIHAARPRTEKVAEEEVREGDELRVLGPGASAREFKDVFGPDAPKAFSAATQKGYAAKDGRKGLNVAMKVEEPCDLVEITETGPYKLWLMDGTEVEAFIAPDPIRLSQRSMSFGLPNSGRRIPPRNQRYRNRASSPNTYPVPGKDGKYKPEPLPTGRRNEAYVPHYVGITKGGKLLDVQGSMIGDPLRWEALKKTRLFRRLESGKDEEHLRGGKTGFFLQRKGHVYRATEPVKIKNVTTSKGVRRVAYTSVSDEGCGGTIILDPESKVRDVVVAGSKGIYMDEHKVLLPPDFFFVPTTEKIPTGEILRNLKEILNWTRSKLHFSGSEKVAVYRPGGRGFVVGRQEMAFVPALQKLAEDARISVSDAAYALKQADETGRYEFWAVPESTVKAAQEVPPPEEQDEEAQQPQEAMAPQMPTPLDMAVAEQMQNLQAQEMSLQQMQQMLAAVHQRAQMIASAGGAMGDPAAAAAAMGGPNPYAMGSAPVGGMDPYAMQGGMDAGMDSGMDPYAMQGVQEPVPAVMYSDDATPEMLMEQVNPQFAEDAAALGDAGVFDASLLASLSESPALKELVSAHVPSLEVALDNLGRILLSLWMEEKELRDQLGGEAYDKVEETVQATFRKMGDAVLTLDRSTAVLPGTHDTGFAQ